ncbi:hypothetical protein PQR02_25150 [Paraburkholderia sediminicola]|uniref:Uncharacterized protein n=1 Tax=Paraburkholderia rhynchosiae TaxID=487049 RepID=A0ACC7N5B5_9BURK
MDTVDSSRYECFHCNRLFQTPVFEVAREWGCVRFDTEPPNVEIHGSEGLECYCSRGCLNARVSIVMAREQTPVRPPGIGPVEVCARCGGPVDMARVHLTYLASGAVKKGLILDMFGVDYLAVVCNQCSKSVPAEAPAVAAVGASLME